jgi:Outer membrane protein beta-barrel family
MDFPARISRAVDQTPSGIINMDGVEKYEWLQVLGSVNIKHDFDAKNSLSVDFDKIGFNGQNPTDYVQQFFDNQGSPTSSGKMRSDKDTGIDIFTSAIDFTSKVNDRLTIEAGAKGSFTTLTNDCRG